MPDMDLAFTSATRREHIHVGSSPASLLSTVALANTKPMHQKSAGQQVPFIISTLARAPSFENRNIVKNGKGVRPKGWTELVFLCSVHPEKSWQFLSSLVRISARGKRRFCFMDLSLWRKNEIFISLFCCVIYKFILQWWNR